ncbi:hypothetical protein Tco_0823465 [Tanacetum coccineum]|uniref:Transposase (Putative), gypsy type n=1 Tax=Tanacetum coccineum TaxID=301880 RepID=A0ABQ5AM12_9ASTR
MGTIDSMKSVLTRSALDVLCEKCHIPDFVHPELPGRNDRIRKSPTGKIGVYSRFFNFVNYRILLSQFLAYILGYFQINLSRLFVIAAVKVSHFEILCRVHGFVLTVDSLKNWNDNFFWVDASTFPLATPWHNNKTFRKDPHPTPAEFNADACNYLADNPAPFRKFSEPFLCFVGISRYYDLDENCYPTFWAGDDEGGDGLLTRDRVIPLADVNDQGNANVQGAVGGIDIMADDEAQAIITDQPKRIRKKMKASNSAGGSGLPPKKLREDHGVFGDAGASTDGKSLAVLQGLLASSTLAVETQPPVERFVISSDTPHDYSTNAADDEVSSVLRSLVPDPAVLMRYFSFGRHLDELHVTWTHLEKKQTRLRTNTKNLEDLCSQSLETASQAIHDAVITHPVTTSHILRRRQPAPTQTQI